MFRTLALFCGAATYAITTAFLITHSVHHFEQLALALQLAVFLPSIVWYLRRPKFRASQLTASQVHFPAKLSIAGPICFFILTAVPFGFYVGKSIVFADESSYRFQAQVFSHGLLMADPLPGVSAEPADNPAALAFKHQVVSAKGWFSKYPIGWPAALALAEQMQVGWLATPLAGLALILLTGLIAWEAYGRRAMAPALWMLVLSPFLMSNCTGRMSHALCALLIAGACWFYLRGIRLRSTLQFAIMYALLIASFHVRPFTAFLMSLLFGGATLMHFRKDRVMLFRTLGVSLLAGAAALASLLLYNYCFTGHALVSPYALYDGTATPKDMQLSGASLLRNLVEIRRQSAQTTLLYTFPFLFCLAAIGFWQDRRSPATRILSLVFPTIVIGHMGQPYGTASIAGERYYFEGLFAVCVVAAFGFNFLLDLWRVNRHRMVTAGMVMAAVQIVMTAVAANQIAQVGKPYREVTERAQAYRDCHCMVFLKSTPDYEFFNENLNLNSPDWKRAQAFFANDPGSQSRAEWAHRFGYRRWTVLSYDQIKQTAFAEQIRITPPTQPMVIHASEGKSVAKSKPRSSEKSNSPRIS